MSDQGIIGSCCCCACVGQGHLAIIEDLGKFADVLPPGCHCYGCTGQIRGTLSLKTQSSNATVTAVTADQAEVTCHIVILYRVMPESCHLAFYRLANPQGQMTNFVIGAVRPLINTRTLDELYLDRGEISVCTKADLSQRMAEFGYEVLDVLFTYVHVAAKVETTINEQMAQRYNRELTEVNQKTAAMRQIAVSNANVEIERLQGVGLAEARKVLASALSTNSQMGTPDGASSAHVMSMMLAMQYFDMLRDVKKTVTYFMPIGSAGSSDNGGMYSDEEGGETADRGVSNSGSRQQLTQRGAKQAKSMQ